MEDLNDKTPGSELTAAQWNQPMSELQNLFEAFSIAASAGDLNQVGKALVNLIATADFYTDSGAADAYVLSSNATNQNPTAYFTGMRIRFSPDNANTTTSTVNVTGLGVKALKFRVNDSSTTANLPAGYLIANRPIEAKYNGTDFVIETQFSDRTPGYLGKRIDGIFDIAENTATAQLIDIDDAQVVTQGNVYDYGASTSTVVIPAGVTKGIIVYTINPVTNSVLNRPTTCVGLFSVQLFRDTVLDSNAASGFNFTNSNIDFGRNTITVTSKVLSVSAAEVLDLRIIADCSRGGGNVNMLGVWEFVPIFD